MLTINHLCKRYGKFTALNDLNLHIDRGEVFGFIGPNGAGKTTTMRIVCGLLKANSGEVYVDGIDALNCSSAIKRKVGYVPDFFGVYDNLKVIEYMDFFASMYGYDKNDIRETIYGLLELVNLSDKQDSFVDGLSRGMKQRLCVARALIHDPELLILDEPASGLDPRARYELKEILRNLGDMGKTILISSHILPELGEMCTSIGIMEKGRLVTSGKVDDINDKMHGEAPIHIRTLSDMNEAVIILKEMPNISDISMNEDEIIAKINGDDEAVANLISNLISRNVKLIGFEKEQVNLETLFLDLTGNKEPKKGPDDFLSADQIMNGGDNSGEN
ncbi:MAG: ABC transporter ATP-binding protein [Lachnospiraceae bacterium]|nr:ABC transporter ATP-binding protein [Lachnospiraceae bacterium]